MSYSTVSRVVNNKGVSADKRERVLRAMAERVHRLRSLETPPPTATASTWSMTTCLIQPEEETAVLFAVRMDVSLPPDLDPGVRADTLAREKAYSHELQRAGKWPHIWRITGQ